MSKIDNVIDNSLKILNDVSTIILGKNKDGSARSIIDAKLEMEKVKRKTEKKKHRKI